MRSKNVPLNKIDKQHPLYVALTSDKWLPDTVSAVVAAKLKRRQSKQDKYNQVAVLTHHFSSDVSYHFATELKFFLRLLHAKRNRLPDTQFQVLIYTRAHWLALDITVHAHAMRVVLLDSILAPIFREEVDACLRFYLPHAKILVAPFLDLQTDLISCSRYALLYAFSAQKRMIPDDPTPPDFVKLLRADQNIARLSVEQPNIWQQLDKKRLIQNIVTGRTYNLFIESKRRRYQEHVRQELTPDVLPSIASTRQQYCMLEALAPCEIDITPSIETLYVTMKQLQYTNDDQTIEVITKCLLAGVTIESVLAYAIQQKDTDTTKKIIDYFEHISVHAPLNEAGECPLFLAASHNDLETLTCFMSASRSHLEWRESMTYPSSIIASLLVAVKNKNPQLFAALLFNNERFIHSEYAGKIEAFQGKTISSYMREMEFNLGIMGSTTRPKL